MDLKLILACDKEYNIGKDNDMLFYIDEDLQRFKKMTTGQIVIMGRKTYESLPIRPLPNRENIVFTSHHYTEVKTVENTKELEQLLQTVDPFAKKTHFLIGGAQLTLHLQDYITECFLTQVDAVYEADRSVKNLFSQNLFDLQDIQERSTHRYLHFIRKGTMV